MANHLIPAIAESIQKNWDSPALSDFKGVTYTFRQVAEEIARLQIIFSAAGVKQGDKVALCAKNSAAWAITFLAGLHYGAVVVPILHEFNPESVEMLVAHSEAKLLFTEKAISDKLDAAKMPALEAAVLIPDYTIAFGKNSKVAETVGELDKIFAEHYPDGLDRNALNTRIPDPMSLALINYTSGSTGNPKGVMISYDNLWGNVKFGLDMIPFLYPGDGMLSMLPLAHMYGLVFEFIFPLCKGCHVTFLGRVPSPRVVLEAFSEVKPKLVITVPLVIEKIIKTSVMPILNLPVMKVLTYIPGLRNIIFRNIRQKLIHAFGGQLQELILGGAALNEEVEKLLRKIRFPFTVGYGMTECAPLLTYEWWQTARPHSCGRMVAGMEAKVLSPDPQNVPGILHVRGRNVMQGYYKNPEATAEALTSDGWLDTGDICTMDADGYIYLRGRNKNMILGPSGQNIYPEEIEAKLNDLPLVAESIVLDREGRIIGIVHPDYEAGRKQGLTDGQTEEKVMQNLAVLNRQVPAYSKVSALEILKEEFQKTPKHSIRRFLYK